MSLEAIVAQCSSNPTLISERFQSCQSKIRSHSQSNQIFTGLTRSRQQPLASRAPLLGLTFAVKDNICVKDLPCSLGSAQLKLSAIKHDAKVVQHLENLGAQLVGTTAMDDYALGYLGESSLSGRLPNPISQNRICGGSSGGAAFSVAGDLVDFAIGTDSGGSVRIPAAACEVAALKLPSRSLPRDGTYFVHDSLDSFGIFTKTVADLTWLCKQLFELPGVSKYEAQCTIVIPRAEDLSLSSPVVLDAFNRVIDRLSQSHSVISSDCEIGFTNALEARKKIMARSFVEFLNRHKIEQEKLSREGAALLKLNDDEYKTLLEPADQEMSPIKPGQVLLTPAMPELPPNWPNPTTRSALNYFMAIANLYDLAALVFPTRQQNATFCYQLVGSKGYEIGLCKVAESIQKTLQD